MAKTKAVVATAATEVTNTGAGEANTADTQEQPSAEGGTAEGVGGVTADEKVAAAGDTGTTAADSVDASGGVVQDVVVDEPVVLTAASAALAVDTAVDQPVSAVAQAAAAAVVSDSERYQVISPLDHDGERYEPGEGVYLSVKQAKSLLGHTVIAI